MKTYLRGFILVVALGATAGIAGAQDGPDEILPRPENPPTRQGTRGANFLQLGVGARGNGMAGAVATTVEGPASWYWNPAGAASTEFFTAHASRQNLYAGLDIATNYAGIAIPVFGGVGGVSFTSLNSGEIQRSTEEEPYGDPIVGDNFEFTATAVSLNYARRLTDRLDLGGGFKFISEGLTDARTTWVALDLGTQFRTGISGIVLGGALSNIGSSARVSGAAVERVINTDDVSQQVTTVQYRTQDIELPTAFRFSVGLDLLGGPLSTFGQRGPHFVTSELAISDAVESNIQLAGGVEYSYANRVFVRGGKRFYNDERATGSAGLYGLSGGVGLAIPLAARRVRVDYAYTSLGDLENVHVFSFEFGR